MPELLLLSNSRAPGMGFLEHATGVAEVIGERKRMVFVPFASGDPTGYTAVMRKALAP